VAAVDAVVVVVVVSVVVSVDVAGVKRGERACDETGMEWCLCRVPLRWEKCRGCLGTA